MMLITGSLPFGRDVDVGLGIAVKTWLDDHAKPGQTTDERKALKDGYKMYLPYGENFSRDLDLAFGFFEALCKGVTALKGEVSDADHKVWTSAHKYFSERR